MLAADAKILIDDNALPRQKEYASWAEPEEANPLEYEAKAEGLTYVKLDGDVGIIGNGAGLVMTTLDMVARSGGKPANFLDIGGGAKAEVMKKALLFVARDPQVQGILVNIFGGITRGEEVASGIIMAQQELPTGHADRRPPLRHRRGRGPRAAGRRWPHLGRRYARRRAEDRRRDQGQELTSR